MDECVYYTSRVCKWSFVCVVGQCTCTINGSGSWCLRLCDVCPTEADFNVHTYGVYMVHQWSGKDTDRWLLRQCIYRVAVFFCLARISKRVLTGWNFKRGEKLCNAWVSGDCGLLWSGCRSGCCVLKRFPCWKRKFLRRDLMFCARYRRRARRILAVEMIEVYLSSMYVHPVRDRRKRGRDLSVRSI